MAIPGGETNVQEPTLIERLLGCEVVQVACGEYHSLYLTEGGQVYSSGKNVEGQLGVGDRRSHPHEPHLIEALEGHKVIQVACGDFHSAALTSAGSLFTWGSGLYGQLGHSSETSSATPLLVRACEGLKVIYVACGGYHTAAIIEGGDVLVWGAGEDGQLGQGDYSSVSTPTFCDALRGKRICQVACGSGLTAALSVDGRVWAWGQLLQWHLTPTLVMDADDRVSQIACGANNMAAWQGPLSPFMESVRSQVANVADPSTLLSTALRSIIDKEEGSDCCFLVGDTEGDGQGRRIHAHAIVLAVRCAQLGEVIEAEWAKLRKSESESAGGGKARERLSIRLPPDVSQKSAVHFLEYLYCDELRLAPKHYAAYAPRQAKEKNEKRNDEAEDEAGEEDDESGEEAKVVEDLLQLSRHFGTKALEKEISRRVASPQLSASLATGPISATLSTDLARAFDNPLFSDLTVQLTGDENSDEKNEGEDQEKNESEGQATTTATSIRAHKCILAARSRYFNAMLLSGLKESYMGEMVVSHIRPSVFVALARYLYTGGDATITPDSVVELFLAANEYSIEGLVKQCERMIENALELEIVADLWAMASLHSSEELRQVCINYVLKEIDDHNKVAADALHHLSSEVIEVVCSRLQSQLAGDALRCATCGDLFGTAEDRQAAKESPCVLCQRPICFTADNRCRLAVQPSPLLRRSDLDGACRRCQQLLAAYAHVAPSSAPEHHRQSSHAC